MNHAQRKFLIDKINEKTKKDIQELENKKVQFPSFSNYAFLAIMEGKLKLKPADVTLEALKKKALNSTEGANWLSEDRMGWDKIHTVKLAIQDIFEIPDGYLQKIEEVKAHNSKITEKIASLKMMSESLETRIQLASDKTLQKMINEVDDMGDISLLDTSLRKLLD